MLCARGETFEQALALLALSPVLSTACLPMDLVRRPEAGGLPMPRTLAAVTGFASLLSRDDRKCQSQIFTRQSLNTLQTRFNDSIHCGQFGTLKIPAGYVLMIAELILGRWTGASSGVCVFKFPLSPPFRKISFILASQRSLWKPVISE